MTIAVWHVIGQMSYELLDGVSVDYSALLPQVVRPEHDFFVSDLDESTLCNRRTAGIPAGIAQELFLRCEMV